ncbi:APC family permease [Vagococcus zengguangii]|uniref:Amino acid permease n=1 Tax=Vagococcus zengguangii TaxID=2571750 RepID=A0A4D7CUN5_9ENTE|nr:amino acid permease [Vagococcus zengguangii]QCI86974.1 amino acid permease [Vagococcus zengguangii]TLG80983.1 amino acid permease [Vagococcus zengguangii]
MEKESQQQYGLMTAITMIVGICIGSGIFFKADDILRYAGGSVPLGVLVLCLGALSIIFGSLSLSELAIRTNRHGGVVAYFEEFVSKEIASAFGWFQTFLFMPTIMVVVAWVAGVYTLIMLGIQSTLEKEIMVGTAYLLIIFGMNYLSTKIGGRFQELTTFVKLIPLIGIVILGVFWRPEVVAETTVQVKSVGGFAWLAALAPVAFSYEGWNIATSISHEVKDSKRNMPLALLIGPLIVLAAYVLYFVSLNNILGPEYILAVGDQAIYQVGQALLGKAGAVIITLFVVISVIGVINGLIMGSIRMPQALASKKMIPNAEKLAYIDPKKKLSRSSFSLALILALIWMFVHYLTQKFNVLPGSDISEIAIVFGYVCYPLLYIQVIKMYVAKEIKSKFKGLICPIFGILGSIMIIVGGIATNPTYVPIFILLCFMVCFAGYFYYEKKSA